MMHYGDLPPKDPSPLICKRTDVRLDASRALVAGDGMVYQSNASCNGWLRNTGAAAVPFADTKRIMRSASCSWAE